MSIYDRQGFRGQMCRVCILFLIGMFVFAQQGASETIFHKEGRFSLHDAKLPSPNFSDAVAHAYIPVYADTVETYDIELEEEKERSLYKEIAIFIIIAAMVGYMVIKLVEPDDEGSVSDGGKEPPVIPILSVSIPFNQSP